MNAGNHTAQQPASDFAGPGPNTVYREKLAQGVFEIQQCNECSRHFFYPRVLCKYCGSPNVKWVTPSGLASVYSTTVVRRKIEDGGDYNVIIAELAEGPRMMARVDGIEPAAVRIGDAIRADVSGRGKDSVLVFKPVSQQVSA